VTGAEAPAEPFSADKPKHPKNKEVGTKKVFFGPEFYLDQADAKSFKDGEEITLMAWGNAFVREIASGDPIPSLTCELNLQGDVKSTEKKVTWLASKGQKLIPAELWDFDYLLNKDVLGEDDVLEDCLNPVTSSMEDALCDEATADLKKDDIIQLERRGYYRVDKGLGDWKDGEEGEKGKRLVLFNIPTGKTGSK